MNGLLMTTLCKVFIMSPERSLASLGMTRSIRGLKVSGENFTGNILTANLLDHTQIVIPNEVRDPLGFSRKLSYDLVCKNVL